VEASDGVKNLLLAGRSVDTGGMLFNRYLRGEKLRYIHDERDSEGGGEYRKGERTKKPTGV
jgi:hypothetical protein